jgi:hypothetical protein
MFIRDRTGVVRVGGVPRPPPAVLTLPDLAVLLVAETAVPHKAIPRPAVGTTGTGVHFLNSRPELLKAVETGGPHADAFRRVVGGWLATRVDPTDLSGLAAQARNTNGTALRSFPEYDPLLRRIVSADGMAGYYRGSALVALADWHKKDEVPYLKRHLGNDSLVTTVFIQNPGGRPVQARCQLRDVALALLIQQTGQEMKDYGFDTQLGRPPNPLEFYTYGFIDDDKRAAALVKFGWWQLKQGIDAEAEKK